METRKYKRVFKVTLFKDKKVVKEYKNLRALHNKFAKADRWPIQNCSVKVWNLGEDGNERVHLMPLADYLLFVDPYTVFKPENIFDN